MTMRAVKVISFGLLLSLSILNEVESDCGGSQNMNAGQTIYVFNPDYPDASQGKKYCMWQITSSYLTKINCTVKIPTNMQTENCPDNALSIQFSGEQARRYCGYGTLDFVEGMNPTIQFDLSYNSIGAFLCQIETEKQFDEYNCQCGQKKPTRIVGGVETGVNEYPMMAGLVDSTERILYCGATIISTKYVLTAAHCVERRDFRKIGVLVGEHDVTTAEETSATKLYRMDWYIIHPYYNDIYNDIAVCKIDGTIEYSAKVGPVCLPFQHQYDSFGGNIVTALGWGLTHFGEGKATKLRKVDLNVISLVSCAEVYNVTYRNMCTYTPGKDTCQMDSGGPLIWQDLTTRNLVLAGITSSGYGCASNEPAVETRTGAYIDWIISVTPDAQYCKVE